MRNINYGLIDKAQTYYSGKGFINLRSPWRVPHSTCLEVSGHYQDMVGSGEQSLYQLYKEGKLVDNTLYQTITPCFRYNDPEDDFHQTEFIKLELIIFNPVKYALNEMVCTAKKFFDSHNVNSVVVETGQGFDLEVNNIEVGSYYQKTINGTAYICGTGAALPRLQEALKLGYSNTYIPKKPAGSIEKIVEECEEYVDAIKQNNPIMALVELSDLLLAIDMYASKYNTSLNDLINMANATKRAFKDGRR